MDNPAPQRQMLLPTALSFPTDSAHPPFTSYQGGPLLSNTPCSSDGWAISSKCCSQQEASVLQKAGQQSSTTKHCLCYWAAEEMTLGLPAVLRLDLYWPAIAAFNSQNTPNTLVLLPTESLTRNTVEGSKMMMLTEHTHHCDVLSVSAGFPPEHWFHYARY